MKVHTTIKVLICCTVLCQCLLGMGCMSVNVDMADLRARNKQALNANLDSFVGKLTTDELVMFAGSPTERTRTSNGGEILSYQYTTTTPKTVITKYSGNGSMFAPHTSVATESGGDVRYWTVRFMFNDKHVLTKWTWFGDEWLVPGAVQYQVYKVKGVLF